MDKLSTGRGKGRNAASAVWLITLCDPIWHSGYRSDVGASSSNCCTVTFTFIIIVVLIITEIIVRLLQVKNIGALRKSDIHGTKTKNSRYCRHHYLDEPKPAIAIAQAACDSSDTW